ncbi:DegQ family serine endoprotease [Abyssibacter sp.]|uniref:DegQ family serine endoprotease n=1 Tax=Abyssibacter sp. TaxID=2320200 RepID=UPI0025B97596|nr:DegQ family serine endoprotease [Abyssibacter sp.]MCK5859619.1 DegQ family serine endoprotease [Abyssibacter sp.]
MTPKTFRCWRALVALPAVLLIAACTRGLPDFTGLVGDLSPVVVNISTAAVLVDGENRPENDWFERFFGLNPGQDQAPQPGAQSLGSGFIISKDGFILTNYHVVAGADEIVVRLSDRRQMVARLVGTDQRSDLALIKIEATGLPTADIGSADDLKVGEWVLAIGSPFGFDYSVTAGIVSAKNRSLATEQYVPFIQTDVAINPGNSGGPLFNLDGEVVGVNSQIYSDSGGYQGVSFAIPVDDAMRVANQLRQTGIVVRGWLGVVVQEVDRALARSFGMRRPEGALVSRVVPNSPAAEAGLQVGDVILQFGDRDVGTSRSLPHMVGRAEPGDRIPLRVLRDGERMKISVRIGALETDERASLSPPEPDQRARPAAFELGIGITELTRGQRAQLGVEQGGVLVTEVRPGSASGIAGLMPGDVIVSVGQQPVADGRDFRSALQAARGSDSVPLLIQRRGSSLFLALDVPG